MAEGLKSVRFWFRLGVEGSVMLLARRHRLSYLRLCYERKTLIERLIQAEMAAERIGMPPNPHGFSSHLGVI